MIKLDGVRRDVGQLIARKFELDRVDVLGRCLDKRKIAVGGKGSTLIGTTDLVSIDCAFGIVEVIENYGATELPVI